MGADDNMVELPRLFPAGFFVPFPDLGIGALGDVELGTGWIMAAKQRERNFLQPFGNDRFRIMLFYALTGAVDIIDFEAEMIQSRGNTGPARQDGSTDDDVLSRGKE